MARTSDNDAELVGLVNGATAEAAEALVSKLTLREKASLCSGASFWNLQSIKRLGLTGPNVSDGPHGVRRDLGSSHLGLDGSAPATCFPCACTLASSWDPTLAMLVGEALGRECLALGVSVLLGPGVNIKRHPLCGRNFEYFSEDPLLAGEFAASFVKGVQSQGVGTSIKHFAANNQEANRMTIDTQVDERTLREIYLPAFEAAVTRSQPWTVMCAYNRLNGQQCSEHDWLNNTLLRGEWGFEGLLLTDWGAIANRVKGLLAGIDLEMPSSAGVNDARIAAAVRSGALEEGVLDRAAARVVSLYLKSDAAKAAHASKEEGKEMHARHHALARRAAAESAVLLKNDGQLLPLGAGSGRVALIGGFATAPRYQGSGSSKVNSHTLDRPLDALRAAVEGGGGAPLRPRACSASSPGAGRADGCPGGSRRRAGVRGGVRAGARGARRRAHRRGGGGGERRGRGDHPRRRACREAEDGGRRGGGRRLFTAVGCEQACRTSSSRRGSTGATCASPSRWTASSPRWQPPSRAASSCSPMGRRC
jgi:beta-glucosidase